MINLFFIIHDHSGARTYANELLGYLSKRSDVAIHRIFIENRDHKEFTVIKSMNILDIYVPQVQREWRISLEKYDVRSMDLIEPFLQNKENIIFHLNEPIHLHLAIEARKRFNAKLVYTLHFLPESITNAVMTCSTGEKNYVKDKIVLGKFMLQEVDKIICISRFAQETICNHLGIPLPKTKLIYNGHGFRANIRTISIQRLKRTFGFDKSERIILYAGRLGKDKGVHALIKAFKKIYKEFPGTRLVLAGNGEFEDLFALCKGIMGKVTFAGNLNMVELHRLYSIAEIGVCPSHFELLGYTPIEMMANQIPVIISNVPGMRELVKDGIDGLVCGVRKRMDGLLGLEVDEENLHEKIKLLLENKTFARELGANGMKKWKNNYTAERMGLKTFRLFQETLGIEVEEGQINHLAI